MPLDANTVLQMVKSRKNIMPDDHNQDDYLTARIEAAMGKLAQQGIHLVDEPADMMLAVDAAVWEINNRDKEGPEPQWLKDAKNTRWLNDRSVTEAHARKTGVDA